MNIIMIGPVFPYKGGIAHYTSLLTKALQKRHDITLLSYKFQYPKFLYPGLKQKDYSNDTFKVDNVKYILHTVNVFSWNRAFNQLKGMNPDLVIFQWWNPFFFPLYHYLSKRIKKKLKKKTMVIAHNILPHERIPLDTFFSRRFFKRIDCFIVHSENDRNLLLNIISGAVVKKTVHPIFSIFNNNDKTFQQARQELGINEDDKVILFFGFIREYKGLETLLRSIPLVKEEYSNVQLYVVGDFYSDKNLYLEIIDDLNIENIHIVDGYIPDKDVGVYFHACDLVVLPYYSASQSGVVQIAYGFNRPVISTDVGGLPEVVEDGITGYIVPPKNSEALSKAVIAFFKKNNRNEFISNIKDRKKNYSWDNMVSVIEELFEASIETLPKGQQ